MTTQRRSDTEPERVVRSVLSDLGVRYRIAPRSLPGKPDLANKGGRWAIFVHGCYWHHHEGCERATVPKRNRDWWLHKFRGNQIRDREKAALLEQMGFNVLVVWECETKDGPRLRERLERWQPLQIRRDAVWGATRGGGPERLESVWTGVDARERGEVA